MKEFPLQILKINETVFAGKALSVNAPGVSGDVTILAKHETMLTSLTSGEITLKQADGSSQVIEIDKGFMEATKDKVTILL